jgi:hypothetical protein
VATGLFWLALGVIGGFIYDRYPLATSRDP